MTTPFHSAYAQLNAVVAERRARRLTPTVPPPRDSDPTTGYPEPEHGPAAEASGEGEREALPPPGSAWAWSAEGDSDGGGGGRR